MSSGYSAYRQVRDRQQREQQQAVRMQGIEQLVQQQYGPGASLFGLPGAEASPSGVALGEDEYNAYQNYLSATDQADELDARAQVTDNGTQQLLAVAKAELLEWSKESGASVVLSDEKMAQVLNASAEMTFPEFVRGLGELNMAVESNQLMNEWETMSHSEKRRLWSDWGATQEGRYRRDVILQQGGTVPIGGEGLLSDMGNLWQQTVNTLWTENPFAKVARGAAAGPVKGLLRGLQMVDQARSSTQVGMQLQTGYWDRDADGNVLNNDEIGMSLAPVNAVTGMMRGVGDVVGGQNEQDLDLMAGAIQGSMHDLSRTLRAGAQVWRWKEYYDAGGGWEIGSNGIWVPEQVDKIREQFPLDDETFGLVSGVSTFLESKAVADAMEKQDAQAYQAMWQQAVDQYLLEEFPGTTTEAQQQRAMIGSGLQRNGLASGAAAQLATTGRISGGRAVVSSMGIEPGDPYYNMISGSVDATHQMVFDPLIAAGWAKNTIVGVRHALKATDSVANTGRLLGMMRGSRSVGQFREVATTAGDDAVRRINQTIRGVTTELPAGATADDIMAMHDEVARMTTDAGDEIGAGFEHIARTHPRWTESYTQVQQFIHEEIVNQMAVNGGRVGDEVIYGRKLVDPDDARAVGEFTSIGRVSGDARAVDGTLVNGISRTEELVPMLVRQQDGTYAAAKQGMDLPDGSKVAEDFIDNEVLNAWVVEGEGLKAMRTGKLGGNLSKHQTVPYDALWSLPFKKAKRVAARAIDYMSESPTRYARDLVERGVIDEDAMRGLGLETRHSISRGLSFGHDADGAARSLQQQLVDEGMSRSDALKYGAEFARRSTWMNPMTLTGKVMRAFSRSAIRGGIEFGKANTAARFRDFVSLAPADTAARLSNQFARATTDAEKIFVVRSAVTEMMELSGRHGKQWADDFAKRAMKMFDEANGLVPEKYAVDIGNGRPRDEVMIPGTNQRMKAGFADIDLAGGIALPDMRKLLKYMQRDLHREGALSSVYDNVIMDHAMGKIWNPAVLYRLSFPLRASGDEIGVAALRENPMMFFAARMAWSATQETNVLPRFVRFDKVLARRHIRRNASYESLAKMAQRESLEQFENAGIPINQRTLNALKQVDTILNDVKGRDWWERVGRRVNIQTKDAKRVERLAREELESMGELENAARLRRVLDEIVTRENPYDTMARLSSEDTFQWIERVQPMIDRSRRYAKYASDLRGKLTLKELRQNANKLHAMNATASTGTPVTDDMLAKPQGSGLMNPAVLDPKVGPTGNQRLDDPLNRSWRLESVEMENLVRNADGEVNDPKFVAKLRDRLDRLGASPEYRLAMDAYLDNVNRLLARRDITAERAMELITDAVEEGIRGADNSRFVMSSSVDGRNVRDDWLHEFFGNDFGSDTGNGFNRGGSGPRRPDGGNPGPPADGVPRALGDPNDHAFHAELAREKEVLDSELSSQLRRLEAGLRESEGAVENDLLEALQSLQANTGADIAEAQGAALDAIRRAESMSDEATARIEEILDKQATIAAFENGDITANQLWRELVDDLPSLKRMENGEWRMASPAHRDRAWRVAVDPYRSLLDRIFDPEDTDAFFRAVGLSEAETGLAPVFGSTHQMPRWIDIPPEFRPEGLGDGLYERADLDHVVQAFIAENPDMAQRIMDRVADNTARVSNLLSEGMDDLTETQLRHHDAFANWYAVGDVDEFDLIDELDGFLLDTHIMARNRLNVIRQSGSPAVVDPRFAEGWEGIQQVTNGFFMKHFNVVLPPNRHLVWNLGESDTVVTKVIDEMADYQSLFSDHHVADLRHTWEVLTEQLKVGEFRPGSTSEKFLEQMGVTSNEVLLDTLRGATAKINERLGLEAGEFALTPIHMEALMEAMTWHRTLEIYGDPSTTNAIADLALGSPVDRMMHGGSTPVNDALSRLVELNNARTNIVDFRDLMARKESEVFRWATRPDKEGVKIGIGKEMAALDEMYEILGGLAGDGKPMAETLDTFFMDDDAIRALGYDPDDVRDGLDRAQDAWLEMLEDSEYLDTLADTSELRSLYDVEPVTVESIRHSVGLDDREAEALQRVVWEKLGSDPDDIAGLAMEDVHDIIDSLADEVDLTPGRASEIGTYLEMRNAHHFDVRAAQMMDDTTYPDSVRDAMTATLFHGTPGHTDEFLPIPEHIELLKDFLRHKRYLLDQGEYDESIANASNFAYRRDARYWQQPSSDDMADNLDGLFDPDVAAVGGGGIRVPPRRPPDEGFKSGSDGARGRSLYAKRSEGVRRRAEAIAEEWMHTHFADPQDLADEFAKGQILPRDGMEYHRLTLDEDGVITGAERIAATDAGKVDYDTLLLEAAPADADELVGLPLSEARAQILGKDPAIFGRPVSTEHVELVQQNVESVMQDWYRVHEYNGGQVTADTEIDLRGLLRYHRQLRSENPDDAKLLISNFMETARASILGSNPSEESELAWQALKRLVDDDGLDSQRLIRSIGDDLLERMRTRIDDPSWDDSIALYDELEDIRPAFVPKKVLSRRFESERKSGLDLLAEITERGYDPLLRMIDTVAREPMILHYYSKATMRTEDEILQAALNPAGPGGSVRRRQAKVVEMSRQVSDINEDWAATQVLRDDLARFRAEGSASNAEDATEMAEHYGHILADYKGDPDIVRVLEQMNVPSWLGRAMDEDPAVRRFVEEVLPRYFDSPAEVTGRSLENHLNKALNEIVQTERMIHESAMTDAYAKMTQLTDNDAVSSQFAMQYRNLFPFWWAEERFMKRLATTVYHSPDTLQRWHLTYKGISSYGFLEENDQGEQIFVYPFGRAAGAVVNNTVGRLFGTGGWELPIKSRITGKVEWTAPSIGSKGYPLLGPFASIKVKALMQRFPEAEWLQEAGDLVLPEMAEDPNMGAIDMLMPSVLKKGWQFATGNMAERYYSQLFNAALLMERAGLAPTEWEVQNDPEKVQEYEDRLRNHARVLAGQEMLYSFLGPSAAQADVPDNGYQKEFRDLTITYGFGEGAAEFLKRHPDIDPVTMFATESVSGGPLPATEASLRHMRENRDFLVDHNSVAYLFFPDPGDEVGETKYHARAFQEQRAMGLRRLRNEGVPEADLIDGMLADIYYQAAATPYYEMKDRHQRELEAVKGTELSIDLQRKHELEVQQFELAHPMFAAENKSRVQLDYEQEINEVKRALQDERHPTNSETDAVSEMVALWDEYRQIRDGVGVYSRRGDTGAALADERKRILREGHMLALNNPTVARIFWERTVLRAMTFDREDALRHGEIPTIADMAVEFTEQGA